MPSIEFEIFCDVCGKPLNNSVVECGSNFYITPCSSCMDAALDEVEARSYSRGYQDGVDSQT